MKVTVELDCTPEEFRRFMGLPDVTEFHEQMAEKMREAMSAANPHFDMDAMMKAWMPPHMAANAESMTELQKTMWQAMMSSLSSQKAEKE